MFKEGQLALLVDRKMRKQLIRLGGGDKLHTHIGIISHGDIIGMEFGSQVATDSGGTFIALNPTLSDYVLKMPRGAQIIYPKDLGQLMFIADIKPGVRVFESGVGSGALSLALLQAGAKVVGYEIREDHMKCAEKNILEFVGDKIFKKNYELCLADAYEGIAHENFDCALLDLPEPWQVVPYLGAVLNSGAMLMAYTPSVTQVMQLKDALVEHGFFNIETVEVLNRGWHIEGQSVRPEHRMVAHTGFLTYCRNLPHS